MIVSVYVQLRLSVPADLKLVTEEVDVPAAKAEAERENVLAAARRERASRFILVGNFMSTKTDPSPPCALDRNDNMKNSVS